MTPMRQCPFCTSMNNTVIVIEALATKCVAARNEANDLRYENNGIRDKVRKIESRVSGIERMLKREEDWR